MRRVGVDTRDFARRFFGGASPIGRTVRLDPLAYLVVAIVLGAAGLLASLPPALRAARSSPLAALRTE